MRMPLHRIEFTHIRQQAHGKAEQMYIHMPLHIIVCICIAMSLPPFWMEIIAIISAYIHHVNRQKGNFDDVSL